MFSDNTLKTLVFRAYRNFVSTMRYKPVLFISVWSFLFAISTLWLMSLGIAPSIVLGENTDEIGIQNTEEPTIVDITHASDIVDLEDSSASAPVHITIDAIGVDTDIVNPDSTDISVLDQALASGAVRYPGSGNLEDVSNMFLFGHSSHLPIVNNKAYKSFNNLEKLKEGDLIRVQSLTKEYHYRVRSVELVKADNSWVRFDSSKKQLTLSTCNNFGSKQDRYVVEADFVGGYPI